MRIFFFFFFFAFVRPALYTHLGPLLSEPDERRETYVGVSPYLDAMGLQDEFFSDGDGP